MKKLNSEQKEAVIHKGGPLLIVAGAGTGKTTVITQRIVNLIETEKIKTDEILAVTFTEKAAGEMEERVDGLLDYGYTDLWISTFHAFCERILREHGLDMGLPTDFKILDQTAAWLLIRQNLDKFELNYYKPLGNPTKFIKGLIGHFSHCKDQEIYPDDYLKYADKLKTRLIDLPEDQETERIKEVANAYHVYQKLLLKNSALDFGDLINYCLKLFKTRKAVLEKYRDKFKYILVDEFQDTNWAQYELIKILAAPKNNLTFCADDDQAIYRWRGASFSNIIQFKKDFPDAKQVSLVKNYRSAQNILDLAYGFIKSNDPDRLEFINKISKKLTAENKGKGMIEHISAKTLDSEVQKTVKKIVEILKKDKKASYSDFAILCRSNDAANPFTRALERSGIPYQFLASRGLYSRPIILDIISYFKLLDNYHESLAVYRILNLPFLKIPQGDIMRLTQYSHYRTKSLYEAMGEISMVSGISAEGAKKIAFVLSLIQKHCATSKSKPISEILVAFLEDSGYLKYIVNEEKQEYIDLLNQFFKRIKKFEEENIDVSLKNFMDEMALELESGEEGKLEFDPETGPDVVKVMTIHGAKGLEFKYVFLVNMVDRRFPTSERGDPIELPEELIKDIKPTGDAHLQEERRICYVAMTRAKTGLFFTSAKDYGGVRKKKLSQFLIEMGYKDIKDDDPGVKSLFIENNKKEAPKNNKAETPYLPTHFSFSQLAAFQKCPLQYKFNFILKIPVKGKAVFSFGKTMHGTLQDFLKRSSENSGISQGALFLSGKEKTQSDIKGSTLGFDYLLQLYDKNWLNEWYQDKKQKSDYYKLGKDILKNFFAEYEKNPPEIYKAAGAPALELPFSLKIGEHTIRGVVDRIDNLGDGVEIIDYKTGVPKEKLAAEDKEQLLIYQIAAKEIFNIDPKKLTYFYLDNLSKQSFLGSDKDLELQKEKTIKVIEEIKKSDFHATPGWQCGHCDFKDICDFAEK